MACANEDSESRLRTAVSSIAMDPRIRQHAEIIANHSVELESGDNVVISVPSEAEDLGVALHEVVGEIGARPVAITANDRMSRSYLRAIGEEAETPEHMHALYEETDVIIRARGGENATETSDVPPETMAAQSQALKPIKEEYLQKRWCLTQFPSPSFAQLAEMSTEAYEEFVWDAINKDWDAQYEHQQQMVEILDAGSEVHIKSGETTDITLGVDGMITKNDDAEHNLPGGEVFTAPVPDSVEGEVLFDMPLYHQGREVDGARLVFENGEVVEHEAATNEDVLTGVLETDEGARRLGELGIGMNRDIDRFTYNMLFDEKMGDTVHMAVGSAYADTVGENREQNDSAVHVDMIVDMSEDSSITVDGELVQKNGRFVFEDGFEG